MVHCNGAQHLKAQASFVDGIRRSGDIQKDGSSLRDNFGYGVTVITAISPEIFIVPYVLANGDAQLLVSKSKDGLPVGRLKISRFVEDVVGGQKHFALLENNTTIANECGFIGDGFPDGFFAAVFHAPRITNY